MLCFELDVAFGLTGGRTARNLRKLVLCPVMTAVNPREIALREQLLLSFQPVLHVVTGLRALVHIIEVSPSSHLVRRWNKISRGLVLGVSLCEPCAYFEFSNLLMRMSIVFHKKRMGSINDL